MLGKQIKKQRLTDYTFKFNATGRSGRIAGSCLPTWFGLVNLMTMQTCVHSPPPRTLCVRICLQWNGLSWSTFTSPLGTRLLISLETMSCLAWQRRRRWTCGSGRIQSSNVSGGGVRCHGRLGQEARRTNVSIASPNVVPGATLSLLADSRGIVWPIQACLRKTLSSLRKHRLQSPTDRKCRDAKLKGEVRG